MSLISERASPRNRISKDELVFRASPGASIGGGRHGRAARLARRQGGRENRALIIVRAITSEGPDGRLATDRKQPSLGHCRTRGRQDRLACNRACLVRRCHGLRNSQWAATEPEVIT